MLVEGRFEAEERLDLIEAEQVSVLCQAPTEYRVLAKQIELRPMPSLRRAVSAGEALDPGVIAAWREGAGLEIHDGYGQTETGHLTGNLVGMEVRDGSMGRPLPGFELRIAEAQPDGEERTGTLEVRTSACPTFFTGYLGETPFSGEWWSTGDVVREDADGYLWYESRDDDLILSAGYRIGPFEVESALMSHPAVADAAAVPAPDPERGSVVRAIVVPRGREPSDDFARELQEHVKSVTAPYKYPRIVDFADELPRTASGKIKRAELRGPSPTGG
jgi:acyl-coenzyme A synthetase/AMP-(fatty) acid ligase